MTSLLNEAKLLGFRIYQDSKNHYQWTVEIRGDKDKLVLEEQYFGQWLLISNEVPQICLKTEESIRFLRILNSQKSLLAS